MGPKWFVNLMKVLAVIIIIVVLAFTVLEAAGLMGLFLPASPVSQVGWQILPEFLICNTI